MRVATPADAEAIDALMKESGAALFPDVYDGRQAASMVRFVSQVDPLLLEDGTYFVLEAGGELVGCGGWSRRDKLYTGGGDDAGDERLLDPATEPARVRAMFVRGGLDAPRPGPAHPGGVRGGGEERGLPHARPVGDDVGAARSTSRTGSSESKTRR